MQALKQLFILAGANGSGKSTISKVLLPQESLTYVNPDEIAFELAPTDPLSRRIEAGKTAINRIDKLLEDGVSFAIESTLSGNTYLRTIEQARKLGYATTIIYTFVDSAEACIARIAARVKKGGHYVPDEDVRRRYVRSKANFLNLYAPIVDHWMIYYNGENMPVLVAQQECGNPVQIFDEHAFDIFKEGLCQTK